MSTKNWLGQNGYGDILALISEVEAGWRLEGVSTRRNWWDILSGGHDGSPRSVSGVTFPVLAVAQVHEGKPVTSNAIQRRQGESPPAKEYRGRSAKRAKSAPGPRKTTTVAAKKQKKSA